MDWPVLYVVGLTSFLLVHPGDEMAAARSHGKDRIGRDGDGDGDWGIGRAAS